MYTYVVFVTKLFTPFEKWY